MIKTTAPLVWEWVERVTGLGRLAGRDFGRWDAEKGNFTSVYAAQSEFEVGDEIPAIAAAVAKLHARLSTHPHQCCRKDDRTSQRLAAE